MKLVVGLGNYGDKYAYTYHNMGFLCVECLADRLNAKFSRRECSSLVADAFVCNERVVLAKPLTYMNLSGQAVKQFIEKYKLDTKEIIVVFDDIDIEKGSVRVRQNGSGGTHNGMRHIIQSINSEDFPRVRIGIGRPPNEYVPLVDYVLKEVPKKEREAIKDAIEKAADEVEKLCRS